MTLLRIFRQKTLRILLGSFLVLQVINLSFDSVDPSPFHEDLSVNEIESCVEFFVEIILNKENAIREFDDHDETSHKPASSFVVFFAEKSSIIEMENNYELLPQMESEKNAVQVKSLRPTIVAPPPRELSLL